MQQQIFNQFNHYNSLPALLGSTFLGRGAFVGGIVAGCLAVAGLGVLVRKRVFSHLRNPAVRMLQIVYALSIALLPVHRYDTVLYVPFLISLVIVQGIWRKLLLTSILVLQVGIWKSGPIRLFAKYMLGLPAEQLDPFVKQYYWDIASYSASIVSGLVLLLVLVYLWQDLRQAQAGRKQA